MSEKALQQVLAILRTAQPSAYPRAAELISQAKLHLCALSALAPTPRTPSAAIPLAREVFEIGAILAIRAIGHLTSVSNTTTGGGKNPDAETVGAVREAFVRNVAQLRPFYELGTAVLYPSSSSSSPSSSEYNTPETRNKVTGLYLLLLITEGRYAEFHSELELLTLREWPVETDRFLAYPVLLERWLMEGSYDRVWRMMKSREVPCDEYGVFSDILTQQIRSEIASSSERAYPKLPLSSTKSLLFLDSEGAVVDFARQRGWTVKDAEIFFPAFTNEDDAAAAGTGASFGEDNDVDTGAGRAKSMLPGLGREMDSSFTIIGNALGYARELETIV